MKKALALLLSLVMVFQMLPVTAFAEGSTSVASETIGGAKYAKVSFVAEDDKGELQQVSDDRLVEVGSTIGQLPDAPERNRYAFVGWFVGDAQIDETYTVSADTEVAAKYKKQIRLTRQMYGNTEAGITTYFGISGNVLPFDAHPTTTWTTEDTIGVLEKVTPESGKAHRLIGVLSFGTTEPEWTLDGTVRISFSFSAAAFMQQGETLSLVKADGSKVDARIMTAGRRITGILFNTEEMGDFALIATYDQEEPEPEVYTVTFMAGDTVVEAREIAYGEPIGALPAAPVREGYTFHHWMIAGQGDEVSAETKVTADLEIVASYTCDYPALNVQGFGNGWTVSVKVPEGALPETTMFRVLPVNAEDYRDAVESAVGGSVGNITAVDLFFVDRFDRSKEIEPLKPVTVNVSIPGLDNSKTHSVVHVKDDGDAEVVQSGIEGSKFTFEADQFSIYAVVEDTKILTVNFYDETGKLLNTQYIRKVDNEVQNLYNPQWDLEYGTEFYGWAAEEGAVSGADIDEINSSVTANWDTYPEGVALNYYAVIKKVYVVTFNRYNDANELVVLETRKVPPEENTIEIPGDLSGADLDDQFLGWIAQDGSLHKSGTPYTVNGHVNFFLKETGRTWLVFDANAGGPGSGADYTPPQLIFGEGVVTVKPDDPKRTGYSFLGWNTKSDGTGIWWSKTEDSSINRFGTTIPDDVTLYAQWKGAQTNYYVIYWQQSVTDAAGLDNDKKTYVYVSSDKREARTGDQVTTTRDDISKGGTTISDYGYFFTYNADNSDKTATVAANGTTVLNVRYDRREITYNFNYINGTPVYKTISGYDLVKIGNEYAIKIDGTWR